MKVVYIGKYFNPYYGGIETVSQQLCEGVSSMGHEVNIIVSHEQFFKSSKSNNSGFDVIKLKNYGRLFSVPICFWSAKFINSLNPDIVHFHLPNPLPLFKLDSINAAKVATYHAPIIGKSILKKMYKPTYKRHLELFDKVIVTSHNIKNEENYLRLGIDDSKVTVIPLGVAKHNFLKEKSGESIKKIIFSGRLVRYKGLDYLVKAMSSIDAQLTIVGDGPLQNKLKQLSISLKLDNKIFFKPAVSREKLFVLLKSFDLFVLPSISEAEAFGMSALEAMSVGLPLITTQLSSGVSEFNLNRKTGFVVKPKSVNDLIIGINQALKSGNLEKFEKNSLLRFKQKYTLDRMINSYVSMYESLLRLKCS